MKKSKIEWCDSTWNPVTGCKHGCEYCYARRMSNRFGRGKGDGSEHFLGLPMLCGERIDPYPYGFDPTFHRYRLEEPAQRKKPQTIFVCSMADLFGAWVPDSWIVDVFNACEAAPQHRYMFLTKNPGRYAELKSMGILPLRENFWYGCTVTGKDDLILKGSTTINTFISIEPLHEHLYAGLGSFGCNSLIIIGSETGNRDGKIVPEKAWVDNICEAADLTHAAVFMKDSLLPVVGAEDMRKELPWIV